MRLFLLLITLVHSTYGQYVMMGSLTATSIKIKTQCDDDVNSPTLLAKDPKSSSATTYTGRLLSAYSGFCEFSLDNLKPNTHYRWTLSSGPEGSFRTPGPAFMPFSHKFALTSNIDTHSQSQLFSILPSLELDLHFLLVLGNIHTSYPYENSTSVFLREYTQLASSRQQAFVLANVPYVYIPHESDYTAKNFSGINSPNRAAALEAYRTAVPYYQTIAGRLYHSFVIGRVLYIVSDTSSERSADAVLSHEQLNWLEALFAQGSQYAFVVWSTPLLWLDSVTGWGAYPAQQAHVASLFAKYKLTSKMLILCAGPMLALDDGSHSPGHVPVIVGGPMDSRPRVYGGPYSHGVFARRGQFWHISITDTGGDKVCAFLLGYALSLQPIFLTTFDTCNPRAYKLDLYTPPSASRASWWAAFERLGEDDAWYAPVVLGLCEFVEANRMSLDSLPIQAVLASLFIGPAVVLVAARLRLIPTSEDEWMALNRPPPARQKVEKKDD